MALDFTDSVYDTKEGTQEEALFSPGTNGITSKTLPKREGSADDEDRERDEGSDRDQRQAQPTFYVVQTAFITATRDQEVSTLMFNSHICVFRWAGTAWKAILL